MKHLSHTDSTPLTSGSYIGLRTINTRVRFDDVQANEVSLSYLHSDHLGSNSLMTDASGAVLPNSQAAYLPFGDWRDEPSTASLTDVGYTGHRHNNTASNDLGLIYMNARYYLPGTGRFVSADTIVPDPQNPQAYNRFSYVENNPLLYIDPTGHYGCTPSGYLNCNVSQSSYAPYSNPDPNQIPSAHAIGGSISFPLIALFPLEGIPLGTIFSATIALEFVWDADEVVIFLAPGYDAGLQLDDGDGSSNPVNGSVYLAQIFNTENLAEDYSGWFISSLTTVSYHGGIVFGEAVTPGEEHLQPLNREEPFSIIFGGTIRYTLAHNIGESKYFAFSIIKITDSPVSSGGNDGINNVE